jgi:hypothetical protein
VSFAFQRSFLALRSERVTAYLTRVPPKAERQAAGEPAVVMERFWAVEGLQLDAVAVDDRLDQRGWNIEARFTAGFRDINRRATMVTLR